MPGEVSECKDHLETKDSAISRSTLIERGLSVRKNVEGDIREVDTTHDKIVNDRYTDVDGSTTHGVDLCGNRMNRELQPFRFGLTHPRKAEPVIQDKVHGASINCCGQDEILIQKLDSQRRCLTGHDDLTHKWSQHVEGGKKISNVLRIRPDSENLLSLKKRVLIMCAPELYAK